MVARLAPVDTGDGNIFQNTKVATASLATETEVRARTATGKAITPSQIPTLVDTLPRPTAPGTTIVWYGDSFIYQSGTQEYTDGSTRSGTGAAQWCETLLGNRLVPLANEGVGGETTAEILARINDVLAWDADIVGLLTAGLNDVKGFIPTATTTANLTSIFDQLNANGSIVITATCPPSNLIDPVEVPGLFALNKWLMAEAQTRTGLIVCDIYSLIAQASATLWRAEYTSDSTHPNVRGAYVIGEQLAVALDKVIPGDASTIVRSDADPEELAPNPTLSGTGGTGTGVIPASTTSTGGTGTGTKVARLDGILGDWFVWDQSAGTNTIFQTITTGYAAGDRLVARFEIEADPSNWGAITQHYVGLEQRDSGNVVVVGGQTATVLLAASGDAPRYDRIIVETNPMLVDAAAVGGSVRATIRLAGVGKIRIGLVSVRKAGL